MFQSNDMSNRDTGREPETIISASVKVEGDFVSQGNVLIEGEVEGNLKTEKDLRVGEHARICADVVAASATIAGEVRGNIEVTGRLELEPTAKVFGDLVIDDLVVASGATICGKISMGAIGMEDCSGEKSTKSIKNTKAKNKEDKTEVAEDVAEELNEIINEEDAEAFEKKETKRTINAFFSK
jgi:cytoskeletal protein CcmA (bactofilin family)